MELPSNSGTGAYKRSRGSTRICPVLFNQNQDISLGLVTQPTVHLNDLNGVQNHARGGFSTSVA